jgi:anti-sigma B factor antagonist
MELSLNTYGGDNFVVLEVGGEVDVYTAPRLRERLVELVYRNVDLIILDLSRVEFLDSTGLGVAVGGLKRMRADGGRLVVCAHERLLKSLGLRPLIGSSRSSIPWRNPTGLGRSRRLTQPELRNSS